MPEKREQYIVLSFASTAGAMGWEKEVRRPGHPGAHHPAARGDHGGRGLGWRMLPEDWEAWNPRLDGAGYDAATPVMQ